MGDLADAIREHLELKRRRGADPAEVAREEHDALAPVTRSHPAVTAPPQRGDEADAHEFAAAGGAAAVARDAEPAAAAESDPDATKEFRVEHDGHWLAADE